MIRRDWDANEVFNRWFMENLLENIIKDMERPYANPFTQRDFTDAEKKKLRAIKRKYNAGKLSANKGGK